MRVVEQVTLPKNSVKIRSILSRRVVEASGIPGSNNFARRSLPIVAFVYRFTIQLLGDVSSTFDWYTLCATDVPVALRQY